MALDHLNSILLEGEISEAPVLQGRLTKSPICMLAVRSTGKDADGMPHVSTFNVEVPNQKLGDVLLRYLKPGHWVRIVGKLYQHGPAPLEVVLIAEHVDFRNDGSPRQ